MKFKTTKQFGTGRETPDKTFTNLDEAKLYVQDSAETDLAMKVNTIYRIYEFDEVIHEVNSAKLILSSKPEDAASGSPAGKGSSSTFNPTPLTMSAKPKGAVQHWKKDEDEKK